MKPGDHRITIETLRSGQPRPYADSEHVVRVTLEHVPYAFQAMGTWKVGEWAPQFTTQDSAMEILKGLRCGFISTSKMGRSDPFQTYLDYLRPLDAEAGGMYGMKHNLKGELASIWEFRTVSPFTD